MTEYQIQPNTRRCSVTGRTLKVGERYYSALTEEGDHFVRQDYSSEAWQGPPAAAFSFWSGKVTAADESNKPRFDDELLEECFHRLDGATEQAKINFRYVIALLLMRRKRLRFDQVVREGDVEKTMITAIPSGEKFEMINPHLDEEQMTQVQDEVFRVLGWN